MYGKNWKDRLYDRNNSLDRNRNIINGKGKHELLTYIHQLKHVRSNYDLYIYLNNLNLHLHHYKLRRIDITAIMLDGTRNEISIIKHSVRNDEWVAKFHELKRIDRILKCEFDRYTNLDYFDVMTFNLTPRRTTDLFEEDLHERYVHRIPNHSSAFYTWFRSQLIGL